MKWNMISRRSPGAWNGPASRAGTQYRLTDWNGAEAGPSGRTGARYLQTALSPAGCASARRTLAVWLAACVLAALCAVPALAAPEDGVYTYILDGAGVLTEEQADALEERAGYVADTYDFAPYVVMIDGLSDMSAEDAALSFYDEYDMGAGENDAGAILLVDTQSGDYGFYVMNTEAVDSETEASMEAAFLEAFDQGWYEGFAQYIQSFANQFSASGTKSASADGQSGELGGYKGYYILDLADILSDGEEAALEEKAGAMARTYGFAPCVIVEDSLDGYEPEDVAQSYYTEYHLGIGPDNNGSLLYMSMEDRDFWYLLEDHDSKVFDEYRYDSVQQAFLAKFRNDDWYGGFTEYLNATEHYLSGAADAVDREAGEDWNYYGGYVADYGDDGGDSIIGILVMFGIPVVLALIISLVMLGKMTTVRHAAEAGSYLKGGLKLHVKEDIFTHTTTTRVKVESDSHSGGGSGGGGGGGGSFSGGGKF